MMGLAGLLGTACWESLGSGCLWLFTPPEWYTTRPHWTLPYTAFIPFQGLMFSDSRRKLFSVVSSFSTCASAGHTQRCE